MAPPSGEMGMTSFPVIEKRPIYPKPLQIGVSFLLTTNRKSHTHTHTHTHVRLLDERLTDRNLNNDTARPNVSFEMQL